MILPKLIAFLTTELSPVYVGVEAPSETSGYVLIDQTGSSRSNQLTTAQIAIQSYGSTLYNALSLNDSVQTAMFKYAGQPEVASVKLETDYNFTNTATKQYRWQAVYQITHYE